MSWHHTVVAIIIIVVVVGIPNRTVLQPCFKSIRVCNRNPKSCMRMNEWLTDCQAEAGMARWLASLAVNEWSRNASQGNISWIIYHLGSMFGYGTSVFSIGIWCCCSRVLFWTTARGDVPQKKINRLFRKKLSIFLSTGECAFLSLHSFRLFVIWKLFLVEFFFCNWKKSTFSNLHRKTKAICWYLIKTLRNSPILMWWSQQVLVGLCYRQICNPA